MKIKVYDIYAVRSHNNSSEQYEPTLHTVKAYTKKEALDKAERYMYESGHCYAYNRYKPYLVFEVHYQQSGYSYKEIEAWSQEDLREKAFKLLITSAAGIYIPNEFMRSYRGWKGYGKGQFNAYKRILSDPENEEYWDAWNELLDKLTYTTEKGIEHSLYQDGDLFAVDLNLIKAWEEVTKSDFEW